MPLTGPPASHHAAAVDRERQGRGSLGPHLWILIPPAPSVRHCAYLYLYTVSLRMAKRRPKDCNRPFLNELEPVKNRDVNTAALCTLRIIVSLYYPASHDKTAPRRLQRTVPQRVGAGQKSRRELAGVVHVVHVVHICISILSRFAWQNGAPKTAMGRSPTSWNRPEIATRIRRRGSRCAYLYLFLISLPMPKAPSLEADTARSRPLAQSRHLKVRRYATIHLPLTPVGILCHYTRTGKYPASPAT